MKPTIHIRSDEFDRAREAAGLVSVADLARAMRLHPTSVARTLKGESQVGSDFVAGALAAFPDTSFAALFSVQAAPVPA